MKKKLGKTLPLEVTQTDIDGSKCNSRQMCMIATALKRQLDLPAHNYISVAPNAIRFNHAGQRYVYAMPRGPARNILEFDKGHVVKPFKSTLTLVKSNPVATPISEKRLAQINDARKKRVEALAEMGLKPKVYSNKRFELDELAK